jgi:hypothetical protein
MSGAVSPLPQYGFMAWCLVKAQGQLYLFLPCTYFASGEEMFPVRQKWIAFCGS